MQSLDREHSGLDFDPVEWFDFCEECGGAICDLDADYPVDFKFCECQEKNMPKSKDQIRLEASVLLDTISPVNGETRTAWYCDECDIVMAARFIPFGLDTGFRVNTCHCEITGNRMLGTKHQIAERTP